MRAPLHLSAALPLDERRADGVCLYVARGTPNSDRAEANLGQALRSLDGAADGLRVEVVDVFSDPKRALKDGIIVTPTLIGFCPAGRQLMMGDLTDTPRLTQLLASVRGGKPEG